ncbi:ER-golgi trafficking TRAPP I complex 85 kDa subunit-domain-containing protein [Gamsiella multidivaricata]|uniref:ER-golgi trafficking TRAPP I complex 85 kDa subunit-domain-containing protein n=1 Tax=Gamsiella multidivaricata TaxID=101098 RepID=UPI0022206A31|nr:ER-golgi trafficking TRAPP I complex 85 kDa subunit-domain-containing protein [Gamsiella multidivaricata]KAG0366231.1 Trafficking protein particle complex 8 [Gamsiella multidivaricata]KAI7819251.1 ER-golgi trafficking TRAPP I complex 85 kDa subunit-domain-containing protein [Gamsiella multidivaricata]
MASFQPRTKDSSARELVSRVMSPRIAVIASQGANELCQANHLSSVVDLLKPFGERMEGRVTVHGSMGLPSAIDNFTLRLTEMDQLEEPDPKTTQRWLAEVVRAAAHGYDDPFKIRGKKQVTNDYLNAPAAHIFPWYSSYRDLFFSTNGVSDHETFEHPVACIIAISSLSVDPINEIHQLNNMSTPPIVFEKAFMDPALLKYYVLIHDCSKGNIDTAMETLDKMRRTFGLHCSILKINSVDPNNSTLPKDRNAKYWTKSVAFSKLLAMGHAAKDGTTQRSSLSSISSTNASGSLVDLASQRSSMSSPVYSGTGNSSPTFAQNPVFAQLGNDEEDGTFDHDPLLLPPTESQDLTMDLLLHPEKVAEAYGCCLSDEDISGIAQMLKEMLAQSIIPYMERNIAHWNEQVAASRKGIAGRFRRFLGAGSKNPSLQQSPAAGPNGGVIYPHAAPEAQMRKLADWAFMLRDYKFALSVYETVKKDFSADKAWKYYGGTQEMIGLCLLMSPQPLGSKNDVDHYFESAVSSYIYKARSSFFGSRATILCYELFKQRNMYRESPTTLTRMTADASDLRNGLFLEQAAHCYLKFPSPQVRKYAFHMIMAGHRFNKADQKEHAYRCYTAASLVYESKGWALVDDHISCSLGRQSYQLGKSEEVLDHYKKLLRESRQSPQQQGVYMKEFLSVYRDYTNKIEADPLRETFPDFPLPVVLGSTARILSTSQSTHENNEAWAELEGDMRNSSTSNGGRTVSAVGEHVLATVNIKNPLQIPVILTDVILGCEHSTSTTTFTVPVDAAEEAHLALYDQQSPSFEGKVSFTAFDCDRIDRVIMEPGQVRTLTFQILPKQEGQIRVMGLHCNVEGQVHAYKDIVKKGKRLNKTKEQMMSQVYEEDKSLIILVAPEMPLLDVEFHSSPEMLLSGEVCELSLEIKNRGKKGLKNLTVRMSHPTFFCIGEKRDEGDLGVYNKGKGETAFETIQVDNSLQLNSTQIILDRVLAPGESIGIPSWLRGEKIGKHSFLFVFSYESEQEGTAMGVRTLRHTLTSQVLPSLKINAFTRPSTKGLNEFILGIETENLQTVPNFEFLQISSMSASWIIEAVNKSDEAEEYRSIAPRHTVFTYYRVRKSDRVSLPAVTPERFMAKALEKLVIGQERPKDVPPPLDLQLCHLSTGESHISSSSPVLKHFSRASRLGWRQTSLATQFSSIPSSVDRRHLFSVYGSNDIDLALFWNIPKMNRRGHHYIIGINLGVQQNPFQPIDPNDELDGEGGEETETARRALYEQTMRDQAALVQALTMNPHFRDESPVKISMRSEDAVQHDFAQKRLCSTPVKVVIKNCSWNKHIAYTLEMLSSNDPMVPQKPPGTALDHAPPQAAIMDSTNPHPNAHPFFWSGSTFSTGYLAPMAEVEVVVMACFTGYGVYDINRWRLAVQVAKAQRKKKEIRRTTSSSAAKTLEEEQEEERQSTMPPAPPQGVGKGFMQMPNLAHYIQVS